MLLSLRLHFLVDKLNARKLYMKMYIDFTVERISCVLLNIPAFRRVKAGETSVALAWMT